MKKVSIILLSLALLFAVAGCGRQAPEVKIDYGTSSIYTEKDMKAAIDVIMKEFESWRECELHSISYALDEVCNDQNLARMIVLDMDKSRAVYLTQCILFLIDFHTAKEVTGSFNPDQEYTDYHWWLARTNDGEWKTIQRACGY